MIHNLGRRFADISLIQRKPLILTRCARSVYLRWEKPSGNFVKLNYDGAVKDNPAKAGIGGIIRDHEGKVLLCFAEPIPFTTSIMAEMLAAKRGVGLACENDLSQLWMEGDAKTIVDIITGKRTRNLQLEKHVIDMKCQFALLENCKCTHIYREGNRIADKLAKMGLRMKTGQVWHGNPPSQIHKLLQEEAAGVILKRRAR
uniref:RNase H type-1 domain-containing protein n=1 Tax=Nymphaea colorata TaxID=210225 RepID=A0A5K0W0Y7_9MAGN